MTSTTSPPHKVPEGFNVRQATVNDADAMAHLFYTSFMPSHAFWHAMLPDREEGLQFWRDAWKMGIVEDSTARTFVVEDTTDNGKLVAFSRWVAPQPDGNLDRPWPELPQSFDKEICGMFFGGMGENRHHLMGSRPHWMLEMLGVDQSYQGRKVGYALVEWGIRQADQEGLEAYLDASMKGAPLYKNKFGFEFGRMVALPLRPKQYDEFIYESLRRPMAARA